MLLVTCYQYKVIIQLFKWLMLQLNSSEHVLYMFVQGVYSSCLLFVSSLNNCLITTAEVLMMQWWKKIAITHWSIGHSILNPLRFMQDWIVMHIHSTLLGKRKKKERKAFKEVNHGCLCVRVHYWFNQEWKLYQFIKNI